MGNINMTGLESGEQPRRPSVSSPQPGPKEVSESVQKDAPEIKGSSSMAEAIAARQAEKASQEQVKEAVTKLNDYVQSVQRDLQFQMDDNSGKTVITVVDRQTNEVVRQIPDDVALRLAQELQQDEPLSLISMKV